MYVLRIAGHPLGNSLFLESWQEKEDVRCGGIKGFYFKQRYWYETAWEFQVMQGSQVYLVCRLWGLDDIEDIGRGQVI